MHDGTRHHVREEGDEERRWLARQRLEVGLLVMTLAAGGAAGGYAQDYKVLQRATLGGEGGWDLLTVDPVAHRLYVARGTRVMVIDADTLKDVGEIPGTAGVHGIARMFAAASPVNKYPLST